MTPSTTLQCYCCGAKVKGQFALVSYGLSPDRVFVMEADHLDRIMADDVMTVVHVLKVQP
jgi:hypothetical protein